MREKQILGPLGTPLGHLSVKHFKSQNANTFHRKGGMQPQNSWILINWDWKDNQAFLAQQMQNFLRQGGVQSRKIIGLLTNLD